MVTDMKLEMLLEDREAFIYEQIIPCGIECDGNGSMAGLEPGGTFPINGTGYTFRKMIEMAERDEEFKGHVFKSAKLVASVLVQSPHDVFEDADGDYQVNSRVFYISRTELDLNSEKFEQVQNVAYDAIYEIINSSEYLEVCSET